MRSLYQRAADLLCAVLVGTLVASGTGSHQLGVAAVMTLVFFMPWESERSK